MNKFLIIFCIFLSGCLPAEINIKTPKGERLNVLFYPGGEALDDLIIFSGKNYFGKAEFQIGNPLGDIGFKLKTGERVQAECTLTGKDIIGQPQCKEYKVYRSTFALFPTGSIILKPNI